MEKPRISCLHYPTTCILLDDNQSFLENTSFKIRRASPCKTFIDPLEALAFIDKEKAKHLSLASTTMTHMNTDLPSSGQVPVQFDISGMYKHIYNKSRFSELSLVVVDFQMPNMNGIEFCHQLTDPLIKILMLTGEADERMAVKLFNERTIDKFLLKGQPNLMEVLQCSILEMQRVFSEDRSAAIIQGLSIDKECCLSDPAFVNFFNKFCHEISATSYYLIEPSGSYLLFNNGGSPTWFVIKTPSELHDFAVQMQDFGISGHLVQQVEDGKLIPYFPSFTDCMEVLEQGTNIEKYLFPAKTLQGSKGLYSYSVIQAAEFPVKLDMDNIVSFDEYNQNL